MARSRRRSGAYTPVKGPTFSYINEDTIDDDLKCCICHDPFTNPVFHSQCGTTFCRGCVDQITTKKCPQCRGSLIRSGRASAVNVLPNPKVTHNLVNKLLVRCDACEKTFPREQFEHHVKKACIVAKDQTIAEQARRIATQSKEISMLQAQLESSHNMRDTLAKQQSSLLVQVEQLKERNEKLQKIITSKHSNSRRTSSRRHPYVPKDYPPINFNEQKASSNIGAFQFRGFDSALTTPDISQPPQPQPKPQQQSQHQRTGSSAFHFSDQSRSKRPLIRGNRTRSNLGNS
mmetsp:Transcript_9510/g.10514  ORF Transcript_9510/g.10514 Transcript_9510/m.10514 type:complete len:289 (+) Transcript_9510:40-906(+)